MLRVTLSNGEARQFDLKPYLAYTTYQSLANEALFRTARMDHGTVVLERGH